MQNVVRMFMEHQGPDGSSSMVWDQKRSGQRPPQHPLKDIDAEEDIRDCYSVLVIIISNYYIISLYLKI